ncbi:hypothetical protein A3219_22515 [Salmonella enterica]|nr:hypothetical protein A3219_22515 [Salmonella enterica]
MSAKAGYIRKKNASVYNKLAGEKVAPTPGHRATFSQEEIDMRRMIFTLNVLLGNIEREGGLYQKKKRVCLQ